MAAQGGFGSGPDRGKRAGGHRRLVLRGQFLLPGLAARCARLCLRRARMLSPGNDTRINLLLLMRSLAR
jgi:hypothetical protein